MARSRPRARETFVCPVCGSDVPVGSPGCRECGSTEETGWSDDSEYDGLDLPDPENRYENDAISPRRYPWWVLALIVAAAAATLLVSMW